MIWLKRFALMTFQSNARWCEPFTFMLARFYYLLEYQARGFCRRSSRFERTFSDPNWQSMEREPRLEALQRRLFNRGETALSSVYWQLIRKVIMLSPHWRIGIGSIANEIEHCSCMHRPVALSQIDLRRQAPYRNTLNWHSSLHFRKPPCRCNCRSL